MSGPIVIKYGGSLLEDLRHRSAFLKEVAALSKKQPVILVHGGGKEISRQMEAKGIKPAFKNGRRITDIQTLQCAEAALSGLNKELVDELTQYDARAFGLSGKDNFLMRARPDYELGFVGIPDTVDANVLKELLERKGLPVFYPLAFDVHNNLLNINADDFALLMAIACQSARLVFLTDTGAILDKAGKPLTQLKPADVERLIADGTITGGMMVKARACVEALQKGVGRVDICKGIQSLLDSQKPMEGTSFVL